MLKGKTAVVYGVGSSLGGAIAKAFAHEGATVYCTNHKERPVQEIVDHITERGGKAIAAIVDATDPQQVNDHLSGITGNIDISFNLIGIRDTQNVPLIEMELEDYLRPIDLASRSHFITATAAGRRMSAQRSGVILTLTATPGGIGYSGVGGFGPTCRLIEGFSVNLASELGPRGVRAVNIRSGGSPDSRPFRQGKEAMGDRFDRFLDKMKEDTMLKEMPMMQDICDTAVFLASDRARTITGVTIDLTVGTTTALNYKTTDIAFLETKAESMTT